MFAASTAIDPELLVLDEILGVGDAYFAQKSFERIREMCDDSGTTVLLVSHDIYAAARLCERMVWLDRGRVLFDGRTQEAMRAYENSVREQEESRLRARKLLAAEALAPAAPSALVEVVARAPMTEAVAFARIAVATADGAEVELPRHAADAFDEGGAAHLVRENGNWAERGRRGGRAPRAGDEGLRLARSTRSRASRACRTPSGIARVACTYRAPAGTLLRLACFDGAGREVARRGACVRPDGQWREATIDARLRGARREPRRSGPSGRTASRSSTRASWTRPGARSSSSSTAGRCACSWTTA